MANLGNTLVNGLLKVIGKIQANQIDADLINGITSNEMYQLSGVLENVQNQINARGRLFIGTCTTAEATADKAVTIADCTPRVGDLFAITFTDGNTAGSPRLSINGGTSLNIKLNGVNAGNVNFGIYDNTVAILYYDGTAFHAMGMQRQSDSDTFDKTKMTSPYIVGETFYRYKLGLLADDGKVYPVVVSNATTADVVDMVTTSMEFPINTELLYFYNTTTLSAGGTSTSFYNIYSGMAIGYSINSTSLLTNKPLYLVGIPQANGKFKLDNTTLTSYFTQSLPTEYDGKIYILVGIMTSSVNLNLTNHHPIYYHDGTNVVEYCNNTLPIQGIINKDVIISKNDNLDVMLETLSGNTVRLDFMNPDNYHWYVEAKTNELSIYPMSPDLASVPVEDLKTIFRDGEIETGIVTAGTFYGDLEGNAKSADAVGNLYKANLISNTLTKNATAITAAVSLQSYRTAGDYYVFDSVIALACYDRPSIDAGNDSIIFSLGFVLRVYELQEITGASGVVIQELTSVNVPYRKWSRRIYYNAGWISTAWFNMADGGDASKVSGFTVGVSVPANAKFTDTTYSAATTTVAGLMSAEDKVKLNSIAANANAYTLPVAGASLGGVKSGTDITVDASGNVTVNDNSHNHTINNLSWPASYNLACSAPTANNQEWSIDIPDNTFTGCHWHVYTAKGAKGTLLKVDIDSGVVSAPYGIKTGYIEGVRALFTGKYTTDAGARYANSALEIRENDLVREFQSDIGYAPSIGFHWSGRIAATLAMDIAGGFNFIAQSGTTYAPLRAGAITGDRVYNATFNDYAEWFEKEDIDETFEPGDIVVWAENGVTKSFQKSDRLVVGVYSDSYGHIVGGEALENMEDNIKKFIPIGLSGRLNVKVVGKVTRGDLIVTSNIPGVGIVDNYAKSGTIIGKAITNKDTEDISTVKIMIINA